MSDFRVRASALVENVPVEQLPALCAMALDVWCAKQGASPESIARFVGLMTQIDGDQETRVVLANMLSTYEAAAFFGA